MYSTLLDNFGLFEEMYETNKKEYVKEISEERQNEVSTLKRVINTQKKWIDFLQKQIEAVAQKHKSKLEENEKVKATI